MVVTIMTDASFNHRHLIGTYAFWIVCDEGRIQQSGILRSKVTRPEQAEFKCLINAMHVLSKASYAKKIKKVIVNTDCLNVIHLINNNRREIKLFGLASWGKYLVSCFNLILFKMKLNKKQIEMRHVRSHISTETKKEWVNDWCDKAAKEQMHNAIIIAEAKLKKNA